MAAKPPKPQVEVRSLSDINYLAANPPQYPHHPELRESLTLYISRVPGTRDIILSTLKPQRKNVTGEDVANSLYYVHLDLPTDGLLTAPRRRPEDVASPRSSGESARSVIPRKPLPSSARVPKVDNRVSDPSARQPPAAKPSALTRQISENAPPPSSDQQEPEASLTNPAPTPEQTELPPDLPPRPPAKNPPSSNIPISRKPLGPRPLVTSENDNSITLPRPVTPTYQSPQSTEPQLTPPSHAYNPPDNPNPSSPSKTGRKPSVMPFSLSLIRRDPTTGGQWNVGKVSSFQTNIPTPETADPNLNPDDMGGVSVARAQKIDIRIETSGYAKYRGMPSIASVDAFRPGDGHAFAQAMKGLGSGTVPGSVMGGSAGSEEGFARQVVMAYSKTWKSNIKTHFNHHRRERAGSSVSREGEMSPEELAPPRRPFHRREGSSSTVGSFESVEGGRDKQRKGSDVASPQPDGGRASPPSLTTEPGPGLKPKGYMFISPWDGRCEFRTSTNGRSLKCRHILDPKSQKFSPVAVAQSIRDAQAMGRSRGDELTSALAGAKPVSELRFNLPSGDLFKQTKDAQGDGSKGKKWEQHLQGQFSKLLQHLEPKSSDEDEWDDDEPMDLSLGQEDAGGGSKGKRAKLGKLIVHDEGLKMMDLVVAANVGVWWTAWERTF